MVKKCIITKRLNCGIAYQPIQQAKSLDEYDTSQRKLIVKCSDSTNGFQSEERIINRLSVKNIHKIK